MSTYFLDRLAIERRALRASGELANMQCTGENDILVHTCSQRPKRGNMEGVELGTMKIGMLIENGRRTRFVFGQKLIRFPDFV